MYSKKQFEDLDRYVLLNIALHKRDGMKLSDIRNLLPNLTKSSIDKILSNISSDAHCVFEPGSFDPFYVTGPSLYNTVSKDDIRDITIKLILEEI